MGRSTITSRQAVEELCSRILSSRDAMRNEDVQRLEKIILMGKKHAGELSSGDIDTEYRFIISVLIEIIKRISEEPSK
ncbi:MAG: hypothetical protein ACYCSG_01325 [Thermoplasmataceae archaeon]